MLLQGSACQGPLWMVRGPAHCPRVDAVKLAATPWASLSHSPYLKSWLLLFLIAAGMVSWSPAGTRGSLPRIEEIEEIGQCRSLDPAPAYTEA